MITLEMVEKLCEKAHVTYDEARTALENANGDMLEAIIELERQGKVSAPSQGGRYSSQSTAHDAHAYSGSPGGNQQNTYYEPQPHHHNFSRSCKRFFSWCGRIIDKGNNNYFDAVKDGQRVVTLPVTAAVLLLIFAFWIILPLCIVGLFFGYHFNFRGKELGTDRVNAAMDKVSQTAENLKQEIKQGLE